MSNPNVDSRPPIELQGLATTNFDLSGADVELAIGAPDMQHPQLTLDGDRDAFEHSYVDGRLVVREKDDVGGGSGVTIIRGGGRGRTVIRGGGIVIGSGSMMVNSFVGGDVVVNGVRVSGSGDGVTVVTGAGGARRKALLQVPEGQAVAAHDIKTVSGDTNLEAINAQRLRVSSISGDIALRGAHVETVSLKTTSGDIEATDVISAHSVNMQSVSGDIDVESGRAPSWNLNTVSGDITARGAQGPVDASSVSGRTRVR